MTIMTEEEKKECKDNKYVTDSFGHIIDDCEGNCDKCTLSYDYVLGFYNGYNEGYADAY